METIFNEEFNRSENIFTVTLKEFEIIASDYCIKNHQSWDVKMGMMNFYGSVVLSQYNGKEWRNKNKGRTYNRYNLSNK